MADQLSTAPHHLNLPLNYVRPESDRPRLSEVITDTNIPVIDLSLPDKTIIISQIANACEKYGFFQVVNHGITKDMLLQVMATGMEFFKLPPEEKAKLYADDPAKKMRLSTSFNVRKGKVHNWRDYLRLHCYPLQEFMPDWPSKPELFKEIISTYGTEVQQLGFRMLGHISESLHLREDYMINVLGQPEHHGHISESLHLREDHMINVLGEPEHHMVVDYYPQCPEPELAFGLRGHTDPKALLTLLLQDQQSPGLQVLKEGKWIDVDPVPGALTVIIGHQIKVLSNGRYKSGRYRVNSKKERIVIASFLCPHKPALMHSADKLVNSDETQHVTSSAVINQDAGNDHNHRGALRRNVGFFLACISASFLFWATPHLSLGTVFMLFMVFLFGLSYCH